MVTRSGTVAEIALAATTKAGHTVRVALATEPATAKAWWTAWWAAWWRRHARIAIVAAWAGTRAPHRLASSSPGRMPGAPATEVIARRRRRRLLALSQWSSAIAS